LKDLVTLDSYATEGEADVVAGLLEANGIKATVNRGFDMPEVYKIGLIGVQVAAEDEQAARDVIAAAQLEEATEIGEDLDELGEDEE